MLTYFFLAVLAVFFGNLSSNVLLLWVLGRRVETLKKQQETELPKEYERVAKSSQEMREKALNYVRLES